MGNDGGDVVERKAGLAYHVANRVRDDAHGKLEHGLSIHSGPM